MKCIRSVHRVVATTLTLALAAAFSFALPARGAMQSTSPTATLEVPAPGAASAVSSGTYCVLGWIHPTETSWPHEENSVPFATMNILHMHNGPSIQFRNDGAIHASVLGETSTLTVTTDPVLGADRDAGWILFGMSFRAADGSLSLWVVSETGMHSATTYDKSFTPGNVGETVTIGGNGDHPAMPGIYGLLAVRDHAITHADVADLWMHRRHHGPYSLDNLLDGGAMNGPEGCAWMVNHAMTTRPLNVEAGGEPHQRAAIVGEAVTLHNVHLYDTSLTSGTSLRAVRPVIHTEGFVHRSPYEFAMSETAKETSFFVRDLPDFGDVLPPHQWVPNVSPRARLLATELPAGIGLVRVIASGNSRAIQEDDGSLFGTGNFVHGFAWNNLHRTAGVLNRPARINAGPWFGFDAAEHPPHWTGDVTKLMFTDFSRFWTSASNTSSIGPGQGVHLNSDATYTMRCRQQGLIRADHPLLVQVHVLKFPGSSPLHWSANQHTRQGEQGNDVGNVHTRMLNTQTWSHELNTASGDEVMSDTRIALAGQHEFALSVGDACYAGHGSLSVVSGISFDGTRTMIDFEHPFHSSPRDGALLRFGPWGFETVWHRWPGLDADDPAVWRGLRLEAGAGEGVVVFSFDAWRPGVDGFVFGAAGWGGMGYEQQIKRSFANVTTHWSSRLNADIWLTMFATQLSHPVWMDTYTAQLRAASPQLEVVWLGDMKHPSTWDTEMWHWWAITQAEANEVAAATVILHPELGSQLDLIGDGLRSDVLHISQRGNQRLAELWTEMLHEAALPGDLPPKGDLNHSGSVNIEDLLILLSMWGLCENVNDCPADLNGDGVVDVSDLLALLMNWS